jgi:hypothetical protein
MYPACVAAFGELKQKVISNRKHFHDAFENVDDVAIPIEME